MMLSIRRSISRKLMVVVLTTTFMALMVSAIAMLAYDIRTYQASWVADLRTQADLVARGSAPALNFDDRKAARENLELLKARPAIMAAALYRGDGELFAAYRGVGSESLDFPEKPQDSGFHIERDTISVFHRIVENREVVGTVYIRARYELLERLKSYIAILFTVMAVSLITAAMISTWMQAAFTKPILAVTKVAREVMQRRDFSLRVEKATEDEIGVLVDAFNDMLNEVGRRATELEESNRILEHEMMERRGAEQALLIADRRKDEFLATLAHELRNPLAPLVNGLAILRLGGANPATSQKAREIMERQLNQMVRLVDDLLDVSRITTGKLAIKRSRVALQPIVQNAIESIGPFIEQRKHRLSIHMPERPVFLDADAMRLSQVFSNLLNNSAKYTNPGGNIGFSTYVEQGQIVIKVVDDGIGIPSQILPDIFKMFTQADYSLERVNAGLGVGLTLAKRLIELHGGTIEANSEGVDRGSTFIVRLPAASDEPQNDGEKQGGDAAGTNERYRILLADDNVDFATSLATLLRAMDHEVLITHNGLDALAAAPGFDPQFAFLDIGLPGLNGYALARRLRDLPATHDCVLVAVTGWGQEKDRQLAQQAGFDHHMVKPVEPGKIQAILQKAWRVA